MLFSELKKRNLVSTSTADTVGRVDGFVLDPQSRSLVALTFKKTDHGSVVPWSDLTAVGADAVTVSEADKIVELEASPVAELAGKDKTVLKKRVLTSDGVHLGKVTDLDLDPQSGAVLELVLDEGRVAGERLIGLGSYALVVRAE